MSAADALDGAPADAGPDFDALLEADDLGRPAWPVSASMLLGSADRDRLRRWLTEVTP